MNASDHELESLTVYGSTVQFTDSGGSGPAILLIHAGVFSAWYVPLAAEPAVSGSRVVRMIRPGYAAGDRGEAVGSVEHQAAACAALADYLDLTEVTVVAHSSGSVIALELAMLRPDLLGSLVIGEPPLVAGLADPADREFLDQVVGPMVGRAIGAAHEGDVDSAFDTFMNAICGPDHRSVITQALGDAGLSQAVRESEFFFTEEAGPIAGWTVDDADIASIDAPVLLIAGADSPPLEHRLVARTAARLANAQITTLPGENHLLPLHNPAVLAETIAQWVAHQNSAVDSE